MKDFTQAEFMRHFNDKYREKFNDELFHRTDQSIIDAVIKVLKSCEIDKYFTLKLLHYDVLYHYEDIYNTLREHEETRKKRNSKVENIYDYINIKDTDIILLKVYWLCRHNDMEKVEERDPVTGKNRTIVVNNPEKVIEVLIAIPRFVNKYYFRISGNYYSVNYQIIDGSTYNNSTSSRNKVDTNTMKTIFTPLVAFRSFNNEMINIANISYKEKVSCMEYDAIVFGITTNAMYYLLANFGYYNTCTFLDIHCIQISSTPVYGDDYYCFEKHGIFISVPRFIFDQEFMVQSFVATIYRAIKKDTNINSLFDARFWINTLALAYKSNKIDKGLSVLDSFERSYDKITEEDLHLPEELKNNMYEILRWIMQEFSNLRVKSNTDVTTKRVRIANYIAHVYATKLNSGIHRITDMGRRVTLAKVIQAIYTQPMYIINQLSSPSLSNLVSYRDLINDNDAITALKFTFKGISGIGENGGSVQPIYKYVDPSHVGIIDMDTSSASDPGMTGILCPMTKIYNSSFNEYEEPHEWYDNWKKIKDQYYKGTEVPLVINNLPPVDMTANRKEVELQELEFNRIESAIEFTDGRDQGFYDDRVNMMNNKSNKKNLFNFSFENLGGLGY